MCGYDNQNDFMHRKYKHFYIARSLLETYTVYVCMYVCMYLLLHVWVTIDGVLIGNSIYWPLIRTSHNYK
jgi:hypothetical protein